MPAIHDWPNSQLCMDCIHSEFLMMSNNEGSSSRYLCHVDCENNDGVTCPEFTEDKNKSEDMDNK